MNSEFFDLLAIAPWLLCPSLVLVALVYASFKVFKGLGHATAGYFAVPPDWAHWAKGHKGYVERSGGRLCLRCTLEGQHFELELADGAGVQSATLSLDPPPLWIEGQLSARLTLGPGWIQLGIQRAKVRWDQSRCTIHLSMRVDELLGAVEEICQALGGLQRRLDQDRAELARQGFTPEAKVGPRARAQALLVWSPNNQTPPPNPGKILAAWARGSDALALSSRGWILELNTGTSTEFEISEGAGGGLGLSVVDMLLRTQGAPPPPLKDPALAEDLLWLLHGHRGAINHRHLRVWLDPGELGEGLVRAHRVRGATRGPATDE